MDDETKSMLKSCIFGGIWSTPGSEEQPVLTIRNWRVIELLDGKYKGERRISGYVDQNEEGRLSTPITRVDREKKEITTCSGRVYKLSGPPGCNEDAEYILNTFLRAAKTTSIKDVSNEVWE